MRNKKELKELTKAQEITINNLTKIIVSLQKERKDLLNESFNMYNKLYQTNKSKLRS